MPSKNLRVPGVRVVYSCRMRQSTCSAGHPFTLDPHSGRQRCLICQNVRARERRHAAGMRVPLTLEQRLAAKIDVRGPDECWPWTGSCTPSGYGKIRESGRGSRTLAAHRVAYELARGPIPVGTELDHTCHNNADCHLVEKCPHRRCCNPQHLDPVTHKVNLQRAFGHGV